MTESRKGLFERLVSTLPPATAVGNDPDPEIQARAVLRYVVDPAVDGQIDFGEATVEADPRTCPNCGTPAASKRSPYCGEACREMAGFVRQFRTGLTLGWILDSQKQVALGQVLWHTLGGGRPLRQQIAPRRSLEVVFKRESGKCQVCGASATTIDHSGSGCNRPINLRAVCDACSRDRPFGDLTVTSQIRFERVVAEMALRIGSAEPIRCCDAEGWDWRRYLTERALLAPQER